MATTRQIALLRGINLGSRRRVAMPKLRELLEGLGYEDVRTHLQSGNVVLSAAATGAELAKVVARNPLADFAEDPARYLVSFLSAKPDRAAVRDLKALDVPPEQFVVHGREVYAWHPNGVQRSKLFKALADGALGVTATARNWNTVTRLLELATSTTSG